MARSGVATAGEHANRDRRRAANGRDAAAGSHEWLESPERRLARFDEQFDYDARERDRRTVRISGHGAEAYVSRNGTRPSSAQRHRNLRPYERTGFRPDRVAMWAVLLGVMLMLAAAASAHAAVLAVALH